MHLRLFVLLALASFAAAQPPERVLSLSNVDRIALVGDSFSACHYALRDKAYLSILSMLSDYNWESFSRSGYDAVRLTASIRNGDKFFHDALSFRDYGVTRAILITHENDVFHRRRDNGWYAENLHGLIEAVRACGAEPILASEFGSGTGSRDERDLKLLCALAERTGIRFWDLASSTKFVNGTRYLPFWGSGHPATRTTWLFADAFLAQLAALPRPAASLKLYRVRDAFASRDAADLLYDAIEERAARFKEISVGHYALTKEGARYYDALNQKFPNERILSEYLKIQNGEEVAFGERGLLEVVMPAVGPRLSSWRLHLSDPSITVYGRHLFTPPYEVDIKFQGFQCDPVPAVVVGDTYVSSDAAFANQVFTIVGTGDGLVLCSPDPRQYKVVPGTLTKKSGSGPATIAYTQTRSGMHPTWYAQLGRPEGVWKPLAQQDGDYVIPARELSAFMAYDKLPLLLVKKGGFSLKDVRVFWRSDEGKVEAPRQAPQEARGAELLPSICPGNPGELEKWGTEGALTAGKAFDAVYPSGASGLVELSGTNALLQSFTVPPADFARRLQIQVWARVFPAVFDPLGDPTSAPITEDSFDPGTLVVELSDNGFAPAELRSLVGLHWKGVRFQNLVPALSTGGRIRIYSKNKAIQIGRVSVKWVD